jgi:hypothetical protein
MSTIGFQLSRPAGGSGGKLPTILEFALASGYAEAQGALLIVDGTGKWAACGTDPAQIGGIALTPGGTDTSGFNILGKKEFPVASSANTVDSIQGILPENVRFTAPALGTIPSNPGDAFGVTRDSDGVWKLDFNKPDKPLFTFVGVPNRSPADASGVGQNLLVECVILDGAVQNL